MFEPINTTKLHRVTPHFPIRVLIGRGLRSPSGGKRPRPGWLLGTNVPIHRPKQLSWILMHYWYRLVGTTGCRFCNDIFSPVTRSFKMFSSRSYLLIALPLVLGSGILCTQAVLVGLLLGSHPPRPKNRI
jgi:hypothetical protein